MWLVLARMDSGEGGKRPIVTFASRHRHGIEWSSIRSNTSLMQL
jgi:hypothetical protein